jgi:hypothetical protein
MSDHDRPRPTVTDDVAAAALAKKERSAAHTLTTAEVAKLFEHEQLPRSQRSIERYCKAEQLDCYWDPLEKCYYITPDSVRRLIGQLKEIQARHVSPPGVGPGPSAAGSRPAQASNETGNAQETGDETARGERAQAGHDATRKALEDKIFNLTIDNSAKEQVITALKDQLKNDRDEFVAKLERNARRVGELETEVQHMKQLTAPRAQATPPDRPTVHDAEFAEVEDFTRHPAESSAPTP